MNRTVVLLLCAVATAVFAEDLGVKNNAYPVDRDAREQMKDVVRQKQKSGELDRYWKDYRNKTIDAVKNPLPLGIDSDYVARAELHDLKFTLQQDYRDQGGKVVARKGTVIEPLKIQPLVTGLMFIDGRDQRQVDYAIAAGRKEPLKIVLTAGSPYALRLKYRNADWNGTTTIPFYFDQRKMIINQLEQLYGIRINSVPAKLSQSGTRLLVEFGIRA
jgi:conjugal transfer pilus assembly protein TraW